MITVLSFGFKYGIPSDADLVFDVRFLPNPFYIEELKHQTGNDKPVQDYVKSFPACGEFVDKLTDMLTFLIPGYVGHSQVHILPNRNKDGITGLIGVHNMGLPVQQHRIFLHIIEAQVHIVGVISKDIAQVVLKSGGNGRVQR